jgi:hypothetical protein
MKYSAFEYKWDDTDCYPVRYGFLATDADDGGINKALLDVDIDYTTRQISFDGWTNSFDFDMVDVLGEVLREIKEYDARYNRRDSEYKYREDELLGELAEYIDCTYEQHYARNKMQTFEAIVDCDHGEGFAVRNILKYASRYGAKEGYNRKDLLKVLHYGLLALYVHDLEHSGDGDHGDV